LGVFTRFASSLRHAGIGSMLFAAVPLTYETVVPPGGHGELDTPAIWVSPYGSFNLLLVTDKTDDYIEIHDPDKNQYLGRLGGPGSAPGKLARPNAVTVGYQLPGPAEPRDVMFIVERDNSRVSMFLLPYGNYLGSLGIGVLDQPMGIALHWEGAQLQAWITDIGPVRLTGLLEWRKGGDVVNLTNNYFDSSNLAADTLASAKRLAEFNAAQHPYVENAGFVKLR